MVHWLVEVTTKRYLGERRREHVYRLVEVVTKRELSERGG